MPNRKSLRQYLTTHTNATVCKLTVPQKVKTAELLARIALSKIIKISLARNQKPLREFFYVEALLDTPSVGGIYIYVVCWSIKNESAFNLPSGDFNRGYNADTNNAVPTSSHFGTKLGKSRKCFPCPSIQKQRENP